MNSINILHYASKIQRLHNVMTATDFKSHFGITPTVYIVTFSLLKGGNEYDPYPEYLAHSDLLYALDFMKRYGVEKIIATRYGKTTKTVRKWIWIYVKKIASLKTKVVSIPKYDLDFQPYISNLTIYF